MKAKYMLQWQFWLRVSLLPIVWVFVSMEYIGSKGFKFINSLPIPRIKE